MIDESHFIRFNEILEFSPGMHGKSLYCSKIDTHGKPLLNFTNNNLFHYAVIMEFTSRKQTPQDYALVPSSSTKIVPIVNQFQALSDYPPLSYNEALLSPKTPQKTPQKKEVTFYKYFTKNSPIDEVYLTPELSPISQTQLLTYLPQLFADGFNWFTDNLLKNRKFYEFILVDSQSAEIFHTLIPD